MVLEHVGMPQPGDCRVVFSASAEELEAAIQAEQADRFAVPHVQPCVIKRRKIIICGCDVFGA